MEYQFEGKRVPWSQIEKYIDIHETEIQPFLTLQKKNRMTIPEVEARTLAPFFELHSLLTKILKDLNLLPNEEQAKLNQLQLCIDTVT